MAHTLGVKPGNLIIPYNALSVTRAGTILATSEDVSAWPQVTSDGTTVYVKDGYALANGASLSQTAYAELFAKIGSAWNTAANPLTGSAQAAPTSGYFRLPNLMGTFLRGVGSPSGLDVVSLAGLQAQKTAKNGLSNATSSVSGTVGGSDGTHTHTMAYNGSGTGSSLGASSQYWDDDSLDRGAGSNPNVQSTNSGHGHGHSLTSAAQAISGDNETRPQNVGVYYIVKLFDNFAQADIYIEPASATLTGVITPNDQTLAGVKTFTSPITSSGLVNASIGSELITVTADRDMSGANNWSGTDWTVGSGVYTHTAGANAATLAGYAATIGNTYKVVLTIVTTTPGALAVAYGGVSTGNIDGTVGTLSAFTFVLIATSTAGLTLTPDSAWAGTIDNVSITQITATTPALNINNASAALGIEIRSTGATCTAMGIDAQKNNVSGIDCTAFGVEALKYNVVSRDNTAVGYKALSATNGIQNTAVGSYAMSANIFGINNAALGKDALKLNITGSNQTAFGHAALNNCTTGYSNSANGKASLLGLTTGYHNTAFGNQAGYTGTSVYENCLLGSSTCYLNTTGNGNVCIGYFGMYNNTASYNTGVGHNVMTANTSGAYNVAVGKEALNLNTTGGYNTALGYQSLDDNVTYSNCSGIGYNAQITGDNQVQLGDSATTVYVYGTVQSRSDIRDKADIRDTVLGLDFICKLRPVDYKWDIREEYKSPKPQVPAGEPTEEELQAYKAAVSAWSEANEMGGLVHDGSKKRTRYHHGLIAQEVQSIIAADGVDFGGFQNHAINGGEDVLSIGYSELIAPLIKAIQEQQAQIEALQNAIR